jgi:hypothetical protein
MAQKVTFSHLRGVFDRVDEVAADYYRLHPCGNKGPISWTFLMSYVQ